MSRCIKINLKLITEIVFNLRLILTQFLSFKNNRADKANFTLVVRNSILILLVICCSCYFAVPSYGQEEVSCYGRFVNPITDVCWRCILPITIGKARIGKGTAPAKRDTTNPKKAICTCTDRKIPIGIHFSWWEAVRLIDVTRTPFCMVNLGGWLMANEINHKKIGGNQKTVGSKSAKNTSFYHVHYYIYPLIYWLELVTDIFICQESSSFDIAYMSEWDPTWNDHKLQTFFNPEAFLFGNPIAKAACAADCVAATAGFGFDGCFWCAGCWGNLYPFSGDASDFQSGLRSANLYSARIVAKQHRWLLAHKTTTSVNKTNGAICKKKLAPIWPKSQYKIQLTYPKVASIGCWPMGMSAAFFESFNQWPYSGEDFGFLLWRKINCCAF